MQYISFPEPIFMSDRTRISGTNDFTISLKWFLLKLLKEVPIELTLKLVSLVDSSLYSSLYVFNVSLFVSLFTD